jgi:hypothetical protein
MPSEGVFRKWYKATLKEELACISRRKQAYWSEAIAVGDPDWLKSAAHKAGIKRYAIQNRELESKNAYIYFLAGKN